MEHHAGVTDELDFVLAADRNLLGSYGRLVAHNATGTVRTFGGVMAFTTGLPLILFNGCLVVERAGAEDLDRALEWLGGLGFRYRIAIREAFAGDLRATVIGRGLVEVARLDPAMILHPIPPIPPLPNGVSVRPVVSDADLDEYHGVFIAAGLPPEVAERMLPTAFATDPDVRLFTAYLDGRAVGTSVAVRTGDIAGVYAVGTLPEARRRGVGTAATWAAVGAATDWGCEMVVLQATASGFPVYEAMGFRTVVRYVAFESPRLTDKP